MSTRWKKWRAGYCFTHGFQGLMAYLRAREAAQAPRHPVHMRLTMRWAYRWVGQPRVL